MTILQTIENGAFKAGAVALISGVASYAFANGGEGCKVFNMEVPRFVVSAGTMGLSSFAGDLVLPD